MTLARAVTYDCTVCGMVWSYEAVRHLACCRDCGSGLLRTSPALELGGAADEGAAGRRARQAGAGGELAARPAAPARHAQRGGGLGAPGRIRPQPGRTRPA